MSMRTLLALAVAFATASVVSHAFAEESELPTTALDTPYPYQRHFAIKGGLGTSVDSVASVGLYSANAMFGVGADTKRGGFFGVIWGGAGRTDGGLDVYQLGAGPDLEWPVGPARLGLRPRVSYLGIVRATRSDTMEAVRLGLGAIAAIDFLREGGWTVGLELEPRIDAAVAILFQGGETYPMYGLRANVVFKRRFSRESDQLAPRIGTAF